MKKLGLVVLTFLMPALAFAHEGHAVEGLLSHTLHGFSMIELGLAASSAVVWASTHRKSSVVRKAGMVIALGLAGLSVGI